MQDTYKMLAKYLNVSPLILGMDISSMVQQVLDYSHSVVTGCKVERSRVAALQIPTVDILGSAQLLPQTETILISTTTCNYNLQENHRRNCERTCTVSRSPALAASRNL